MNNSVREEIEKAAKERDYGSMQAFYFLEGAEFGFNLAMKHCQVLVDALTDKVRCDCTFKPGPSPYIRKSYTCPGCEALEQFDKITKDETTSL